MVTPRGRQLRTRYTSRFSFCANPVNIVRGWCRYDTAPFHIWNVKFTSIKEHFAPPDAPLSILSHTKFVILTLDAKNMPPGDFLLGMVSIETTTPIFVQFADYYLVSTTSKPEAYLLPTQCAPSTPTPGGASYKATISPLKYGPPETRWDKLSVSMDIIFPPGYYA